MKKILYIATTADNRNRLDGETVKCRLLKEFLCNLKDRQVISIDTDNWKKHTLKLAFKIIINYFKCDKIVISSADKGANIVLKFFEKIKCKKDIYYFVIGGKLAKNISNKKWKISTYQRIKQIYVEAGILKKDLALLKIENVTVLKNFRKVENFKNNYKQTEEIKFVYYGRIIKEKGIEEAIKLINRLNSENINCTLYIYGQCQKEYLKYLEKSFSKKIVYCGEIKPNNKIEYEILSKYDILIFPTEYDGECLPGALIDAYISELAVVASNWKYAKECILNGKNGIIFEYKNYEDMYIKTKELIESGKIMEYKKKSFELSKDYIIDKVLQKFRQ
jgi:glycosyltransferase involved in cell wall biosynthesis